MNNAPLEYLSALDGVEFVMESSTASIVDAAYPTRFRYRQQNAMVWGDYFGDTVQYGRFIGRTDRDTLTVDFAHSDESGNVTVGEAISRITRDENGRLRLTENFFAKGAAQSSVCVEADGAGREPKLVAMPTRDPFSIDGARFVLASSTASKVNHESPSTFEFHEAAGLVWGSYAGDTVTIGHSIGVRTGIVLREHFIHEVGATGEVLRGDSESSVGTRSDGRRELVEEFVLDGVPGTSICVEVRA